MARTADDQSRLNFDNLNGSNLLEIQRSLDKCGNLFKVNSISAISSGEHGLRDFVVFLTSVSFDRSAFIAQLQELRLKNVSPSARHRSQRFSDCRQSTAREAKVEHEERREVSVGDARETDQAPQG